MVRLILLIIHVTRQNALINRPPLLDQCDNICQSRLRQDDARSTLGHVRRATDRNADFRLPERVGIVDSIPGHSGHMPGSLQMLDDDVFILWIHLRETVGRP